MRRQTAKVCIFAVILTSVGLLLYAYNVVSHHKNNNIVVAAIRKSGSTYILTKISKALQYELNSCKEWNDEKSMQILRKEGSKVLRTHILPTPSNLEKLKKYVGNRIVVHVRDPRAAVLAAVYHHTTKPEEEQWYKTNPAVSTEKEYGKVRYMQEYLNLSLDERKDFMIKERFISNVRWIQEWCALKEREDKKPDGFKIIITSYDELLADEDKFFQRVYQHFAIDKTMIREVEVAKDKDVRFRSGNPNEWRTAFSAVQIARMNKDMPQWLLDRFGWQP